MKVPIASGQQLPADHFWLEPEGIGACTAQQLSCLCLFGMRLMGRSWSR